VDSEIGQIDEIGAFDHRRPITTILWGIVSV
jgi:hypothetical protein